MRALIGGEPGEFWYTLVLIGLTDPLKGMRKSVGHSQLRWALKLEMIGKAADLVYRKNAVF
jgi:hypothetical protein